MKSASSDLIEHIEGEVLTLATCWRITRTDGVEFFFTDHDQDITFEGDVYLARAGYSRTAISNAASMSVDNLDVDGVFDDESITVEALRAGAFDQAECRVFLVNWADPSMGALRLRRGWFGEVVVAQRGTFRTELRGLTQALSQKIGELYTPECRADLGDGRCKVPITSGSWTFPGTVLTVTDRDSFTASIGDPRASADGWYDGGVLTWTTGHNAGRSIEVQSWTGATGAVSLYLPMPYDIEVGDTFTIYPGCDRRLETCANRFDNVINFRGEPYVPGQDKAMDYPNAR